MFPLATPTTSGLWVDWLSLAIVLAGVVAFVCGLADVLARIPRKSGQQFTLDPVTAAAYAAPGLVGLAVVVMLAGGRGILVAQAVFLALAAWGVVCAVARARRVRRWWTSAPGSDLVRNGLLAAAVCWSIWFWVDVFRDHVGLPGMFDGIVHTAYYLKIIEVGVPTLGRVPIGFATLFGTQLFEFYPTGTHSLVAITSGFWGQWGVISHAGILKAWFTLAVAAAPWTLFWFVRRVMPAAPWWTGLALVLVVTPGVRFPIEAAHEGGASRLLAHVLMMPIYADVLLGRFTSWRSRAAAGILLGLAFLMHPSAFVTLAALIAYVAVFDAASDAGWRRRVMRIAGACCAVGIGGLVAAALLKWNGGAAVARDAATWFSWTALGTRLQGGWTTLFDAEYGMGPVKETLVILGFVMLVVSRRTLGLSWRVVAFPVLMLLVGALALSAQLIALPGFRLLGGAFYDETPRVIELMYEPVGVCLVALGWSAWRLAAVSPSGTGRAKAGPVVAVALVLAAVVYAETSKAWVSDHVGYWDTQFSTARISRLQTLGTWIERNTEPDAILFYPPFDTEIWQAWTGRRGAFMYGECHVHNHLVPCNARKDLVNRRIDVLTRALQEPATADRCLSEIDRFGRPGYFLVPTPFASTQSFSLCTDATYVATLDGHAVIRYRKP